MPRRSSGVIRVALAAFVFCAFVVATVLAPRPARAAQAGRHSVDVLVADAGNLQILAFWVALGGGYFAREGLDVHVVAPDGSSIERAFTAGGARVAVLSGPEYERLI